MYESFWKKSKTSIKFGFVDSNPVNTQWIVSKVGSRRSRVISSEIFWRRTVGCTGVGIKTSEKRSPDKYAVCTSDDIKDAQSIPDVK